jgi:hypothetical protein
VPGAPGSLAVKLASGNEVARRTGLQFGVYEAEIHFYREIAHTVGITTPSCLFADIDPQGGWFTLVLADVTIGSRVGDMLEGGTLDQAAMAMEEVVKLHAPRWNDASVAQKTRSQPDRWQAFVDLFPQSLEPFLEDFGSQLEPEQVALCERIVPRASELLTPPPMPFTVLHGDYRLDNMAFGSRPGSPPVTVFDWQTSRVGPPLLDVTYYLGSCLTIADRRQHERELLRLYHEGIRTAGISDFSWDELWEAYRRNALYGAIAFVGSSPHVERTERGQALYLAGVRQFATLVLDLESERLFPAP